MQIKLSENFRAVFYAPFYATLALGLFKKQGLDIQLQDSPSPGSGIADMEKGLIDVVWGGPLRVIKQRDTQVTSPNDLVAFCEVAAKDPFFLVAPPQTNAFELAHLRHLKLGTVSEVPTPWLCLQQDLRDAGIDPMVLARGPERSMPENLSALARGELDVVQLFEPFVSQAVAQGVGQVVHAAHARGWTAYTTFIATQASIDKHREAFEAMVLAIEQFSPWLQAHGTDELAKVVQPFYPDLPHSILASAMARYASAQLWSCQRAVSRAGFARLGLSMQSSGFVRHVAPYEDCIAPWAQETAGL
jgi:NitT/TauT family transport system substrate-binding protein